MAFDKSPPIGTAAQAVAKAANLSALLQAITMGVTPIETIEGLLVAAETAIVVQMAVGVLDRRSANRIRRKIAKWGKGLVKQMRKDGTAEEMRKHHEETLAEFRKAREEKANEQAEGDGETKTSQLN